jgi:hypothetical protein
MSQPNLAAMRAVADRLDSLGLDYAFVGGSIVNLLLDNPTLSPARPTDDVDVIPPPISFFNDVRRLLDRTSSFYAHAEDEPGAPLARPRAPHEA